MCSTGARRVHIRVCIGHGRSREHFVVSLLVSAIARDKSLHLIVVCYSLVRIVHTRVVTVLLLALFEEEGSTEIKIITTNVSV